MSDPAAFRAWLEEAIANAPQTTTGVPLIGAESLHLRDANAAALINALADIIEAACVLPTAVPMTHAEAA